MSEYVVDREYIGEYMEKPEISNSDNSHVKKQSFRDYSLGIITEGLENNRMPVREIHFALPRQQFDETSDQEERYELNWVGKKAAILECFKPTRKILRPVIADSRSWETTENLYIEGDNLDVLKLLQNSYRNRIRMIYIDPPYNIGNGFIYRDDYSLDNNAYETCPGSSGAVVNAQTHARCHSGWCSMMYPRLVLARNLLTDDGVIFISIDEYELGNLKMICNEIFGESSFITIIGLEITKTQGMKVKSAKKGSVVKNFEYILCYAKNTPSKKIVKNILFDKNDGYDPHFCYYIQRCHNRYLVRRLTDVITENREIYEEFRKYQLTGADGRINIQAIETAIAVSGKVRDYIYREIPGNIYQEMACAVTLEPEIEAKLDTEKVIKYKGYLLTRSAGGKLRQYSSLKETLRMNDEYKREYGRVTIRGNLWKGFYSDMMNVAKEGGVEYKNGKKPVRLIYQLAKWIGVRDGDIVLDFFSGSATTAHAVMELNAQDGGHRKYIMVQLNEDLDEAFIKTTGLNQKAIGETLEYLDRQGRPHYLSELGKQRIINATDRIIETLQKQKDEKGNDITQIDLGFRVFRLDSHDSDDQGKNTKAHIDERDPSSKNLSLLYHVLLDIGFPLTLNYHCEEIEGVPVYITSVGFMKAPVITEKDGQQVPGCSGARKPVVKTESNTPALIICLEDRLSESVLQKLASKQPDYIAFRKSVFNFISEEKIEEIFCENSPGTIIKIINPGNIS